MQLEIDIEDFEKIMAEELTKSIGYFEADLKSYKNGGFSCGTFSIDEQEDIRQIKKMVKAMKRVRSWYSVAGTYDE